MASALSLVSKAGLGDRLQMNELDRGDVMARCVEDSSIQ